MIEYRQYQQRKNGKIKRHVRSLDALSVNQLELAEAMADRYEVPLEQAAKYLDWYAALLRRWIDQTTFEREIKAIEEVASA